MTQVTIDPRELLEHILAIVAYKGDKNTFITKYIALCEQATLIALVDDLPEEEQVTFEDQLEATEIPEERQKILLSYFSEEELALTSYRETKALFEEMVQNILPTLDEDKKSQLANVFASSIQSVENQLPAE